MKTRDFNKTAALDLKWVAPGVQKGDSDVSITKQKKGFGFTFRHGCEKKMSPNGIVKKLEFAIMNENTIVFRPSDRGYTLSTPVHTDKDGNVKSISNPCFSYAKSAKGDGEDIVKALENLVGDYELKYERHFKLYYISKEE